MSDVRFPDNIKPIVNRTYGVTRGANIYRSSVQGGLDRQGRDYYFDTPTFSVVLVLSTLSRQFFYYWLNSIDGGANTFVMQLDSGQGLEDHQVQITSDLSDQTTDNINWAISFSIKAERAPVQEADECLQASMLELYPCYGRELGAIIASMKDYVSTGKFV